MILEQLQKILYILEKYLPTFSLNGSLNIDISSILDFSLDKDEERGWLSRERIRYRKTFRGYKDIEKLFLRT